MILTIISSLLIVLLVALITTIAVFYFYRRFYAFNHFTKEGIPGPKPHWLFGNAMALADESTRHLAIPNWSNKYGKMYGYYEGSTPTLVTSDVDVVAHVFVKQFPSFHSRKNLPLLADPEDQKEAISMFVARGDRWKRLRTIVNPTFSTAKMRALMPLVHKCQEDFIRLMEKRSATNGTICVSDCFKLLTLDTIAETAFGVELSSLKTEDLGNPVLTAMNSLLDSVVKMPLTVQLATIIPESEKILFPVENLRTRWFGGGVMESRFTLTDMTNRIIKTRKENGEQQQRQDLLQMMLELEESVFSGEMKGLTIEEIVGQSILFMIAGYETSSNAMSFMSFMLANNPRVQDKLIAEIDEHFKGGKAVDYDSVFDLPYLEGVINETLRLFPIAPLIINRLAMKDTVVNGIHIPKGLSVMADVWTIHRDEEQWGPVETDKFHPERFLDDYPTKSTRSDAAFIPFGYGPRICIGMRFALLQIKVTFVNILRKYRFEKSDRTGDLDSLKLNTGFTMTAADGIWVKIAQRSGPKAS